MKALCRHYDCVTPRHEITEDLILHVTPCRHLKEEYVRQRVAYLTGYSVVQNNATVTLIGAEVFCELFRSSISITETDRVVEDYITSFFRRLKKTSLHSNINSVIVVLAKWTESPHEQEGQLKTQLRPAQIKQKFFMKENVVPFVLSLYNGIF